MKALHKRGDWRVFWQTCSCSCLVLVLFIRAEEPGRILPAAVNLLTHSCISSYYSIFTGILF